MIEIDAAIEKADISVCRKLQGFCNAEPVAIGGETYALNALVFVHFDGAIDMSDRLYHGVYRFELNEDEDAQSVSFSKLPGVGNKDKELNDYAKSDYND